MLTAPFAGRVGIRKLDLGQYVSPGTSLITLQQLDPIFVDFPVPEKSFDVLKPGQAIEVEVDAYLGQIFHGVIKTVGARVAEDSRFGAGPDDTKKRQLWSGMVANVNVIAGAPQKVVTLPRTAVTYTHGDSVFVVKPFAPDPGGAQAAPANPANEDAVLKVERRVVRAGDTREDRVAIVEGVEPGETIVTEGQLKLQSGARGHYGNWLG